MTAAYFEDHPTDPDKVILRKLKHDFGEPWAPVSIGVDVTKEGAHVVGIYALDNDTSQIFYAKYHYAKDRHAPQRKWVGLTDEEIWDTISRIGTSDSDVNPYAKLADARAIEKALKEKNHG
jgi:hypothetical protein